MSFSSPLLVLLLLPLVSPVELASPVSPVKLLLLPLLPLVSPVELGRRTPPWPHPYWDIPGDYCRYYKYTSIPVCNDKYTMTSNQENNHPYWDNWTYLVTTAGPPPCLTVCSQSNFFYLFWRLQHIVNQLQRSDWWKRFFSGPNTQRWTAALAGN